MDINKHFEKIGKSIETSVITHQFESCRQMINVFQKNFPDTENVGLVKLLTSKLNNRIKKFT